MSLSLMGLLGTAVVVCGLQPSQMLTLGGSLARSAFREAVTALLHQETSESQVFAGGKLDQCFLLS